MTDKTSRNEMDMLNHIDDVTGQLDCAIDVVELALEGLPASKECGALYAAARLLRACQKDAEQFARDLRVVYARSEPQERT